MLRILGGLAKAALNVAVLPVAVVVDVVTLPSSAMDSKRGPFDTTGKVVDNIAGNLTRALEP